MGLNKKIKICYLSHFLVEHDYRFLSKLVEREYETYLVAYTDKDIPKEIVALEGLNIIHRRPIYLQKWQKFLYVTKVFDFRRILREIKPDVLHSGYIWKDGLLAAASGFHPHLSMPWGTDIIEQAEHYVLCRWITKYVMNHADMVTCDAEIVKQMIVRQTVFPEEKIVVFPWGLELDRFNSEVDGSMIRRKLGWEENIIIVMNRAFKPIYGISYFIQALPRVIEVFPDVRVLLIGKGHLEGQLRCMVKEYGVDDYIHFPGWIPLEEMPKYLAASDIYVSSSLSDGASMCLLEAMACGLPVIVTDIPAILEWVNDGENGCVVSQKSAEELTGRIIKLVKNRSEREKMAQNNLMVAQERLDWNKNFDKLEGIYRKLYTRSY